MRQPSSRGIDHGARIAAAIGGLLVFGSMAYILSRGNAAGFDIPVRTAIHGVAFPALTAVMRAITMLGSAYLLVPLAAMLLWRLAKGGEHRRAYLAAVGILSAEAALQLLKLQIHRPRPEVFFGLVQMETYSFPSGHAFVPAVYYGILAGSLTTALRWRVAVVVTAALLGFSRVYLGYHYPSDVVAGWALAVVWLAMWSIAADRWAATPH